ncbi:hypothetical protein L596_009409 [Steinernema carpocapsae]|uniref:Uncharacterized protein n=1 Tax=Steinernema carpocapsae TaxID=34508 RepID=A0A4U5PFA1_STECR|nr:hypothetical protein L596_009409 [Steinernema carpocapsae]
MDFVCLSFYEDVVATFDLKSLISILHYSDESTLKYAVRRRLQGPYYRQLRIYINDENEFKIDVIHKHRFEDSDACDVTKIERLIHNELVITDKNEFYDLPKDFLSNQDAKNCMTTTRTACKDEMSLLMQNLIVEDVKIHIEVNESTNIKLVLADLKAFKGSISVFSCSSWRYLMEKTLTFLIVKNEVLQALNIRNIDVEKKTTFWIKILRTCPAVTLGLRPKLDQGKSVKSIIQIFMRLAENPGNSREHVFKAEYSYSSQAIKEYLLEKKFKFMEAFVKNGSDQKVIYKLKIEDFEIEVHFDKSGEACVKMTKLACDMGC